MIEISFENYEWSSSQVNNLIDILGVNYISDIITLKINAYVINANNNSYPNIAYISIPLDFSHYSSIKKLELTILDKEKIMEFLIDK